MKNKILHITVLLGIFIMFLSSCKKENLSELSTSSINSITQYNAICGGNITADNGSEISSRGVCWSTNPNPTVNDAKTIDGSGIGEFTSHITGLTINTVYYVRAYATNSDGTSYGNQLNFTTKAETVVDSDGNIYNVITIGSQVWTKENLKTTHYRNGDAIPNVSDNSTWNNLTTGAYCNYNNDTSYVSTYGRLYNFYTIVDNRNLCPEGWHVPTEEVYALGVTDKDITILDLFIGNPDGAKMKEVGTTHWNSPNSGATNESGFTALPGGIRNSDGAFSNLGQYGSWWSSSIYSNDTSQALYYILTYDDVSMNQCGGNYKMGMSVRCVGN